MNSSLLKKAFPHIAAILIFIVIAVVYCKPALQGKVLNQSDVVGWKGMAQQSFEFKEKYGHFPLWSESAFGGMPAYTFAMGATTNISTGYLSYLLNFGLPKPIGFFVLACICFYILSQVLGINPWLGIMGSITYAYSTFDPIIVAVGHDTQMQAIAYAPGVVATFLMIFQRKYLFGVPLFAILFGFQVATSHLQVVYYTVILLGFITIASTIQSWKNGTIRQSIISIALAIFAGGIGFCTYAVGMFPLQEYAKETKRGGKSELVTNTGDKNKTKGGLDKDYAFMWSYGIGETATLFVPGIYGGGSQGKLISSGSKFAEKAAEIGIPEENAVQIANGSAYWGTQPGTAGPVYLGAAICFLAIFAGVYLKSWHKWWIIPSAILGIVLAWGKNFASFNYFLFDYFPFYNKFRAPTQALFLPQLVFPVFAALGINQLITSGEQRELVWKKFKSAAYITAGIIAVLLVFYFTSDFKGEGDNRLKERFSGQLVQSMAKGMQPTPQMQQQANELTTGMIKGLQIDRQAIFGGDLIRTLLFVVLSATLIGLYVKNKINPVILIAGLILVTCYDLLAEGRIYLNDENFVEATDYEAAFNPTFADAEISKDPDQNFRVLDQSTEWWQDATTSYHHNSLGGYSPAKLGLYQDLLDSQLMKGNISVYNMLNTRYIIQRAPNSNQVQAARNLNAYGACWLVKSIHFVANGNEEMKALDSINLKDTAVVQKIFESSIKFMPEEDSSAKIKLLENLNDKLTYSFSSSKNQFAVFSEIYYDKGWNVYLDGAKVPYCKVDYVLRGMSVPAGNHSIEFRFEPAIYKLGNTVSALASIIVYLILIAALVSAYRDMQKPNQNALTKG